VADQTADGNGGRSEHVPSRENISAALTPHKESQPGSKASLEPQLLAAGEIGDRVRIVV